jgi:hypothetical protein
MCRIFLAVFLAGISQAVCAAAIADQFGSGYGGVKWGTSVASLVGMLPGGDHFFSAPPGERAYMVRNDDMLFGVPRDGMRIQYYFGDDNGVDWIAMGIPYERREQLLGSLVSLFGSYAVTRTEGVAIRYVWPTDHGITMSVRASRDPTNGILEFWVARPSPKAVRQSVESAIARGPHG